MGVSTAADAGTAFSAFVEEVEPRLRRAFTLLRGAGDIRKVSMRSARTGESIEMVYWIEGEYIKDAMKEINYFMRDWREDAATRIFIRGGR